MYNYPFNKKASSTTQVDNLISKLFTKVKTVSLTPEEKISGWKSLQQHFGSTAHPLSSSPAALTPSLEGSEEPKIFPLSVDDLDLGISSR